MANDLRFESKGLGELLSAARLFIPMNQRSYAWEAVHITHLLQDINAAVLNSDNEYFLGTIVLVHEGERPRQIADGQQRLVTASIILARIRDIFFSINRRPRAKGIDETYLRKIDLDTEETVPQLQLNINDNEYFRSAILRSPADELTLEHEPAPTHRSNRLLRQASAEIDKYFRALLANAGPTQGPDQLLKWVNFMRTKVTVVLVTVPDELGAFRIFETLNDRGLRASQSDILKNYFLSRSGSRLDEAHGLWNGTAGALNAISGDKDDHMIKYFRNLWILQSGPTREKEVADTIKREIAGELNTLKFLTLMKSNVFDYVSVWSPGHTKWSTYKDSTKKYLTTLVEHLKVEQIRPLLFAVALHFTPEETDKAFKLFVAWSVRFMIAGGGRGGTLDTRYGELAKSVGTKEFTKARELRDAMKEFVPNDLEFANAFATATVAKTYLRRYYLRALDKTLKRETEPEYVANEDEMQINLDHVLAINPDANLASDEEMLDAATAENMLGNMVLLRSSKNTELGNASFADKRATYAESYYSITSQVADYDEWGMDQIRERQAAMAEIAKETWGLQFT